MEQRNIIVEKTISFSVAIIKFSEILNERKKHVVSKQLLRCGTSIGANVYEAQHAESRADFIHKMKIAVKEANETLYWLTLCEKSDSYPFESSLKDHVNEIIRIISRIILTSKEKSGKNQ
jgi:four helix bundle protein